MSSKTASMRLNCCCCRLSFVWHMCPCPRCWNKTELGSEQRIYTVCHSALSWRLYPLTGTLTTLHCSRISYREEVHSNRTCRLIKSLLLFPPPQLLLLYSISLGRAGAVPAPSSFSPLGTGWSQYIVAPHQCDCSAAHRSRAEQSWRKAEERGEEEEEELEQDGLSPLRQAGIYSVVSRPFNMSVGSKGLAGISGILVWLLFGSWGTGAEGKCR